jgi:hypothetical protein
VFRDRTSRANISYKVQQAPTDRDEWMEQQLKQLMEYVRFWEERCPVCWGEGIPYDHKLYGFRRGEDS